MTPAGPEPRSSGPDSPVSVPDTQPRYRWYHLLGAILAIAVSLTVGIFLLTFPWTPFWDANYFASLRPEWYLFWEGAYLRGAVSALGAINLLVSLAEVFRLRRFASR